MTPVSTLETQLATVTERVNGHEIRLTAVESGIRWIIGLTVTTLLAAVGGLLMQVLKP